MTLERTREKVALIRALLRPHAPEIPMAAVEKYLLSTPQGPHKFATILLQEAKQLLAMDRYERRALSRRRFAIRAFDLARRQADITWRPSANLRTKSRKYRR
jgi:hypothetical protein